MGYGSRALELLQQYYEYKFTSLAGAGDATTPSQKEGSQKPVSADGQPNPSATSTESASTSSHSESLTPRAGLPPLLQQLHEVDPPRAPPLDYIGVAFGVTHDLFRFWKRNAFLPLYLRQTSVCFHCLRIYNCDPY